MRSLPVTDLRYIRPEKELPVSVAGFNDGLGIYKAYRIGWEDSGRGFQPYDWETFDSEKAPCGEFVGALTVAFAPRFLAQSPGYAAPI